MKEDRKIIEKLSVGATHTIPWDHCPPGRPEGGATMGIDQKLFSLTPVEAGLEVKRLK